MRKIRSIAMAALCAAMGLNTTASLAEGRDGKTVFTTCAACHLATGEGLPGAFPPLVNLPATFEKEGGKEYLISVVLQGLNGPIKSQGQTYAGFMQAFAPTLSDDEVAGVLSYVLTGIAKSPLAEATPVSAEDVAAVRKKIADKSLPSSHALRQQLDD
ncbi:cytochrome c [Alteromonas sp. DY56-G5]|uniref:c-type cytochrome n=1 Tax=Alteromonas sp. DY56-G5 TaxID=2967128 RepID=UPI00352A3AA9|tara:strand:- start:106 stop:579 length:474 start_codon:yes stop_codon:yes gene_type:complete